MIVRTHVAAVLAGFALTTGVFAADPATRPSAESLATDMRQLQTQFAALFPTTASLADPARRAASGVQGIELLHRVVADADAIAAAKPEAAKQMTEMKASFQAKLLALGDPATKAAVDTAASGTDKDAVARASRVMLEGEWIAAGGDATRQTSVVDKLEPMAKADPSSTPLTVLVVRLHPSAATPALADRLAGVVSSVMKNPIADRIGRRMTERGKLKALEGKPMIVAGKTPDGKDFTTADWKGRVVLVDFWATWCGPCKAELPRVKKAYADYHAKGLELLGVSNDYNADALTRFTAEQQMPWPELFDAAAAADQSWNPITLGYGISGIPTMFLIDKKGVCRTVRAREDFETLIPQLLSE